MSKNQVRPEETLVLTNKAVENPEPQREEDNYIPFLYSDLCDRILQEFSDAFFRSNAVQKFKTLCKKLLLRNQLRVLVRYQDLDDIYEQFDPDADEDIEPIAEQKEPFYARVERLENEVLGLINTAEYDEVPKEEIDKAQREASPTGATVNPCDPDLIYYRMFERGQRDVEVQIRNWKTFYRKKKVTLQIFSRLVMLFRVQPDYLEVLQRKHTGFRAWLKSFMFGIANPLKGAGARIRPHWVYLKLFKDVIKQDIDMIMPGTSLRFTWFDLAMIWGPIVFGFGSAVYKALTGTLSFSSMTDIVSSLVLVVLPITWGIRGYFAVKAQEKVYEGKLNTIFLLHNLNNNQGVIDSLIDEAEGQEVAECMLGYFFLWKCQAQAPLQTKEALDKNVEAWLQKNLDKENIPVRLNFDVADAVRKLLDMRLVKEVQDPSGNKLLQAVDIDQAIELLKLATFNEDDPALRFKPGSEAQQAPGVAPLPPPQALPGSNPPPPSNAIPALPPPITHPSPPAPAVMLPSFTGSMKGNNPGQLPMPGQAPIPGQPMMAAQLPMPQAGPPAAGAAQAAHQTGLPSVPPAASQAVHPGGLPPVPPAASQAALLPGLPPVAPPAATQAALPPGLPPAASPAQAAHPSSLPLVSPATLPTQPAHTETPPAVPVSPALPPAQAAHVPEHPAPPPLEVPGSMRQAEDLPAAIRKNQLAPLRGPPALAPSPTSQSQLTAMKLPSPLPS